MRWMIIMEGNLERFLRCFLRYKVVMIKEVGQRRVHWVTDSYTLKSGHFLQMPMKRIRNISNGG